jgi:hypothetical protein
LEQRNAALAAAISERVCFVPRDQFWPLGNAAKELITGVDGGDQSLCRCSFLSVVLVRCFKTMVVPATQGMRSVNGAGAL